MLPGLCGRTGLLPTEECRHWKLSVQSGLGWERRKVDGRGHEEYEGSPEKPKKSFLVNLMNYVLQGEQM